MLILLIKFLTPGDYKFIYACSRVDEESSNYVTQSDHEGFPSRRVFSSRRNLLIPRRSRACQKHEGEQGKYS